MSAAGLASQPDCSTSLASIIAAATPPWHSPCCSFPLSTRHTDCPQTCGKASHACQPYHACPRLRNARYSHPLAHPPDPHGQPILTLAWPPHVSARPRRKLSVGDMADSGGRETGMPDGSRRRRFSSNYARRRWYAEHRSRRFCRRFGWRSSGHFATNSLQLLQRCVAAACAV